MQRDRRKRWSSLLGRWHGLAWQDHQTEELSVKRDEATKKKQSKGLNYQEDTGTDKH